jgi:hypothetical protein
MASLEKQVQELTSRVEKLEAALRPRAKAPAKKASGDDYKGATGGVRYLIDKGFFDKHKRKLGDVTKELGANGYHYSSQAIHDALSRLSNGASMPMVVLKEGGVKKYVRRK